MSMIFASGLPRVCTSRIFARPLRSGRSTAIWRSKRPGRSSAGSRMSGRLVAAIMMMLSFASNPSISTSSWLSVCSRSSWPPPSPAPRWRPTASISSMKMMHGLFCLACSNRSRTRDAPTPTNISTKSEPEIEKNGTPASPATARASSVLPVPGGPYSSTPVGIRAPSAWNFFGFSRNSLISCSSSTASSTPATSRNVIFGESADRRLARDLPNDITFEPPPWTWFIRKIQNPRKITNGRMYVSSDSRMLLFSDSMLKLTPAFSSCAISCGAACSTIADFVLFFVSWVQLDFERFALVLELDRLDFALRDLFRDERLVAVRAGVARGRADQFHGQERQHQHDEDRERGALE